MSVGENYQLLTDPELVQKFVDISLVEYKAHFNDDIKLINELYDHRKAIVDTLDSRGRESRRVLLPLLDHRNAQVRYDAAQYLRSREPERANATLKDIAEHGSDIQRGLASLALWMQEEGIGQAP